MTGHGLGELLVVAKEESKVFIEIISNMYIVKIVEQHRRSYEIFNFNEFF